MLLITFTCTLNIHVCMFVDKMKDAIIAKVAAQAADYYKSAYSASQVTSVKQVLEKVIKNDITSLNQI